MYAKGLTNEVFNALVRKLLLFETTHFKTYLFVPSNVLWLKWKRFEYKEPNEFQKRRVKKKN